MTRRVLLGIAAAAATFLVVVALAVSAWHDHTVSRWEAQVVAVQRLAAVEQARTQAAQALASTAVARADLLAARAQHGASAVTTRIQFIHDSLPPDTVRDPVIDTLVVETGQWHDAYLQVRLAADTLRGALTRSSATVDSLSSTLDRRPKPRSAWIPALGVGPFVGVCSGGRFCAGAGVTLSWSRH